MKTTLTALDYMDIVLTGIIRRRDFSKTDTTELEIARDKIRFVLKNNPPEVPVPLERIIERVETVEPRVIKEASTKPLGALLKFKDVAILTGYSRSSIWRMEKEGSFPKRREIGPRTVRWLREEVEAWIASRPIKS